MNIQVSKSFKKMTGKAIFSIVVFMLVYIVLLLLAIGLTILCGLGGVALVYAFPKFFTLALGIGLASLGIFVLIFLFKFLFKKHKVDRSHLIEITREEEPGLFKFIDEIVKEVDTDFPKKIYLSADVNASVFYDSNFWSMFFPIKKNLQIGLGLVNTVTELEFRAILAHEFGHFSQRSMKVGSYVYNVNQVIFNMLYDNESFENMIQRWGNVSGYFSIFVVIAAKIIEGIQFVLRKMYEIVNLNYMALSREMEFHADEVAANVTGYLPLKESLLRMDLANYSYNAVLDFYDNKIGDNIRSRNVYNDHFSLMTLLAKENDISFKNNLPLVSPIDTGKYNKSKLNIKDQWASHPSTEERILALEKLNIVKESKGQEPAIYLFSNAKNTSEKLTEKIFSGVSYTDEIHYLDTDKFHSEYSEDISKNSFPKAYNGYYDNKNPIPFDVENIDMTLNQENFDVLFGKENVDMVYEFISLENDKKSLESIHNKELTIKTFDYDGIKYNASESFGLSKKLDAEILSLNNKIAQNDIKIYSFFYQLAVQKGKEDALKSMYQNYFGMDAEIDKKQKVCMRFWEKISFVNVQTPFDVITRNFNEISLIEIELKKEIRQIMENEELSADISKLMRENMQYYTSKDLTYFANESYYNDNLQVLYSAVTTYSYLLSRYYFLCKLKLLKFQIELTQ